jgi:hypothetical protein
VLAYALALSESSLIRRGSRFPRAVFAGCTAGAVAGLILAFGDAGPYRYLARLPVVSGFRVPERFLLSWSLGLALAAAVALGYWITRVRRPRVLAAACLVILTADLVTHALRAAPTAESRVYDVEPAIVPEIRARLGRDEAGFPTRFVSWRRRSTWSPSGRRAGRAVRRAGALKGTLGMRYGLESASGRSVADAHHEPRPANEALALAAVSVAVLPAGRRRRRQPTAPPVLVPVTLPPAPSRPGGRRGSRKIRQCAWRSSRARSPAHGRVGGGAPGTRSGMVGWGGSVRLTARADAPRPAGATPTPAVLVLLDSWEKG